MEVTGEEEGVGVTKGDEHSAGLPRGVEVASGVEGSTNQLKNNLSGWKSGRAFSPILWEHEESSLSCGTLS